MEHQDNGIILSSATGGLGAERFDAYINIWKAVSRALNKARYLFYYSMEPREKRNNLTHADRSVPVLQSPRANLSVSLICLIALWRFLYFDLR